MKYVCFFSHDLNVEFYDSVQIAYGRSLRTVLFIHIKEGHNHKL